MTEYLITIDADHLGRWLRKAGRRLPPGPISDAVLKDYLAYLATKGTGKTKYATKVKAPAKKAAAPKVVAKKAPAKAPAKKAPAKVPAFKAASAKSTPAKQATPARRSSAPAPAAKFLANTKPPVKAPAKKATAKKAATPATPGEIRTWLVQERGADKVSRTGRISAADRKAYNDAH